jgi:hypothetical protein
LQRVPHAIDRRRARGERLLGGETFQHPAQFDQFPQVLTGQRRHVGTPLGHELHQVLGGEHEQGLADGGTGDADHAATSCSLMKRPCTAGSVSTVFFR